MNPRAFDELARSTAGRGSRRRLLALFGAAAAGGLALPLTRQANPARSQDVSAPATPVVDDSGAGGSGEEPVAVDPDFNIRRCDQWILSGGPSPSDPIHIDDELTVLLNEDPIFEDRDGTANVLPALPFGAQHGDQLTVVARDLGSCRKIGPLWLHCAQGGEARFLSGGFDQGCDPERPAPDNFYRESWRI